MPRPFLGLPVHWVDDLPTLAATHVAVCAIGTPKRASYIEQVEAWALASPLSSTRTPGLADRARKGGSIVSAGVVIAAHTTIGRHVIVNRGSLIGQHTGDRGPREVSPGANIAGCVRIGPGALADGRHRRRPDHRRRRGVRGRGGDRGPGRPPRRPGHGDDGADDARRGRGPLGPTPACARTPCLAAPR